MTHVEFFCPGTPLPQGSKAHVGNGRLIEMADRKTKTRPANALRDWRDLVAARASDAMRIAGLEMHYGPVVLEMITVKRRPPSYPKTLFRPDVSPPDWDKLARSVGDACSGIVFRDDSQVIHGALTKLLQWDLGASAVERGPVGCYVRIHFHTSESVLSILTGAGGGAVSAEIGPEHVPLSERIAFLANELEWFAEEYVADNDEARRFGTDRIPFTAKEIRETMALLDAAQGEGK